MMIFTYDEDGIIATDQMPNGVSMTAAYYQKFIHSVFTCKFENFGPKKMRAVCQYGRRIYIRMLRNQSSICSLITRGKHFAIQLIPLIRVHLTSTFFQN